MVVFMKKISIVIFKSKNRVLWPCKFMKFLHTHTHTHTRARTHRILYRILILYIVHVLVLVVLNYLCIVMLQIYSSKERLGILQTEYFVAHFRK